MGIALEVTRIVREEARSNGAVRVAGMRLRVGRWSGVETESLRFALEALCDDPVLAGCRVEIETVEPGFRCRACQAEFTAESYFDACPRCGALGADLVRGDELAVAEIEVEDT